MSFEGFEIFAVGIVVGSVIGLLVSALLNARAISEMQEAKDNYEMLAEEMEDAAELLSQIQSDFNKRIKDNSRISAFYKKLEAGMATYKDASDFSAEVGQALSKAYEGNIDESILADGTLTAEVAEAIIPEPLRNNYNIISSATEQVQTSLNENAGIGIKALVPEYDTNMANGIIKHATSSPYDNIKASFLNSVVNYSQSIVDKSVEKNADFQYELGMRPTINMWS